MNSKGKILIHESSVSLPQNYPGNPSPKPHLSSARVAPNPSQTTSNNPRNFFQASDPGARLRADIPFFQTLLGPILGCYSLEDAWDRLSDVLELVKVNKASEPDPSVSITLFFAPPPAILIARTRATPF